MKTTGNVATVAAMQIRAAVKELTAASQSRRDTVGAIGRRLDALDSLNAIAHELEQHAGGFAPEATSEAADLSELPRMPL